MGTDAKKPSVVKSTEKPPVASPSASTTAPADPRATATPRVATYSEEGLSGKIITMTDPRVIATPRPVIESV
jgi:hypothetical protein